DPLVTGVQTCALPISDTRDGLRTLCRAVSGTGLSDRNDHEPEQRGERRTRVRIAGDAQRIHRTEEIAERRGDELAHRTSVRRSEIGRASCRERVATHG